jgi:hypothetical protein
MKPRSQCTERDGAFEVERFEFFFIVISADQEGSIRFQSFEDFCWYSTEMPESFRNRLRMLHFGDGRLLGFPMPGHLRFVSSGPPTILLWTPLTFV